MKSKDNQQTQFTMRINSELLDKIKEKANSNKRSTVKEIEFMLEKSISETIKPR